jgi:hypothetical protein
MSQQPTDVPTDPAATVPLYGTNSADDYAAYYAGAQQSLEDLQLQESLVAQILEVIDDAGLAVRDGAPDWIDPDVFGGSRHGERMARHTLRAQSRVYEALNLALAALAQHHEALNVFVLNVRNVEAQTVDQLASVRSRLGSVAP